MLKLISPSLDYEDSYRQSIEALSEHDAQHRDRVLQKWATEARQRNGRSRFWLVGGKEYWGTLTIDNELAKQFLDSIHWSNDPFSTRYDIIKEFRREWLSLALDQFKKMVMDCAQAKMK